MVIRAYGMRLWSGKNRYGDGGLLRVVIAVLYLVLRATMYPCSMFPEDVYYMFLNYR